MRRTTTIQEYFAKRARCYEEAYSVKKTKGLRAVIYRLGWFPLRRIFRYTREYLAAKEPSLSVLDIGCGTGIYAVELARRATAVTALDSCKEMIDATENLVEQSGVGGRVMTVLGNYLDWSGRVEDTYDLALAVGVMDYVDGNNAGVYLTSFGHVAREVIITFPAKSRLSFLTDFSYRRHGIRGYSYREEQIRDLLTAAGLEIVHFKKILPGTYWVHARRCA